MSLNFFICNLSQFKHFYNIDKEENSDFQMAQVYSLRHGGTNVDPNHDAPAAMVHFEVLVLGSLFFLKASIQILLDL